MDASPSALQRGGGGISDEGGGRARWARMESPSGPVAVVTDDQGTAVTHINFFPTSDSPPPECTGLPQATPDQLPAVPYPPPFQSR
jgi:hypothetical protein